MLDAIYLDFHPSFSHKYDVYPKHFQLVKPEEMVNPNVDELSMMTYLSQYPNAKLQPNAPLRPKANPSR
jgi:hypothetical protein